MHWKVKLSELGNEDEWQAEWKWDGIRGQMIKRNDEIFVWSRGEELMTEKFPEYHSLTASTYRMELCWMEKSFPVLNGKPCPLPCCKPGSAEKILQKNIYRKPIAFFAYDILEYEWERYPANSHYRSKTEITGRNCYCN